MEAIQKIETRRTLYTEKKRVAAYARVSMESDWTSHSILTQISYYSSLIQHNPEWEYAGVYADYGISGRSMKNRTEFNQMLEDAEEGKIDLILTKSISRFARNTVDLLETVRELKNIGVEVRFEKEHISSFTGDGELMLTILASLAQEESRSISTNVKWSVKKRFEQGIPNGHKAPYGYEWDGEMFRPLPGQGKIVQEIFEKYLAGESAHQIAKDLREGDGKSEKVLSESGVKYVLSNSSYTGTGILQKNVFSESGKRKKNCGELAMYLVDGLYEPIISEETFEKASAIRKERAEMCAERKIEVTPFSGKIQCGICGRSVSRRTAGDKKVWVCNTKEHKGKDVCGLRRVPEEELFKAWESLGQLPFEKVIVYDDSLKFVLENGETKQVERSYGGYKKRNEFSGKLVCGLCGSILKHDTWNMKDRKKAVWRCHSGKGKCLFGSIYEDEVREAAEEIMGDGYSSGRFLKEIRTVVCFPDQLNFYFKEGEGKTWQRKSK